jgi:hypothetical protein
MCKSIKSHLSQTTIIISKPDIRKADSPNGAKPHLKRICITKPTTPPQPTSHPEGAPQKAASS